MSVDPQSAPISARAARSIAALGLPARAQFAQHLSAPSLLSSLDPSATLEQNEATNRPLTPSWRFKNSVSLFASNHFFYETKPNFSRTACHPPVLQPHDPRNSRNTNGASMNHHNRQNLRTHNRRQRRQRRYRRVRDRRRFVFGEFVGEHQRRRVRHCPGHPA